MGDGNFRPPQNPHRLTDPKIWYKWLRRRPLRLCQIWCKSVDASRQMGEIIITIFLFIPFFMVRSWPVDGFLRLMAQITRTRQGCAFWGFRWYCFPFQGWNPPKTVIFGGVNRRFQQKPANYWKFHVIETTALISTKFCTTIETIKWSSSVVPIGAQQIQDGGRPPFRKPR